MTTGYRSMYERLTEIEAGINSQVRDTVGQINTYTKQIADLNEKIISASAIGGQPANDLYDKRDKLVAGSGERRRRGGHCVVRSARWSTALRIDSRFRA